MTCLLIILRSFSYRPELNYDWQHCIVMEETKLPRCRWYCSSGKRNRDVTGWRVFSPEWRNSLHQFPNKCPHSTIVDTQASFEHHQRNNRSRIKNEAQSYDFEDFQKSIADTGLTTFQYSIDLWKYDKIQSTLPYHGWLDDCHHFWSASTSIIATVTRSPNKWRCFDSAVQFENIVKQEEHASFKYSSTIDNSWWTLIKRRVRWWFKVFVSIWLLRPLMARRMKKHL
jgi:hypothetical protein